MSKGTGRNITDRAILLLVAMSLWKNRAVVSALTLLFYVVSFILLYPHVGQAITPLAAVPVVIFALCWGVTGGLLAAIGSLPLHLLLMLPPGGSITLAYVERALEQPGNIVLLLVGLTVGILRDLGLRFEQELRERQAAVAALSRTEETLAQRVAELEALYATMVDLRGFHDLDSLLEIIIERAVRLLDCTSGAIYITDPAKEEVRCVVSYNTPEDYRGIVLKYGEGAAGLVAQSGEPLIIDDYGAWAARVDTLDGHDAFRTLLSVPLIIQGAVLGVIHILHLEESHHFTQHDLDLLVLFAAQAVTAIESTRRLEAERLQRRELERYTQQLQNRERFLSLLNDITQSALQSTDPEDLLQLFANRLGELFHANGCYITVWDEVFPNPVPSAAYGSFVEYEHFPQLPGEPALEDIVLSRSSPIAISDTTTSDLPLSYLTDHFPVRSLLGLPLVIGEETLGAVILSFGDPQSFNQQLLQRAEQVAAHVALALHNLRLLTLMQQLALTDPLTGLYNRRGFLRLAQREIEQALRFGRALCVLTCDIDHFKRVNDTYGHTIGDEVLVGLTQRLRNSLRAVDLMGRYGGEEFMILLPETGERRGSQIAERLRREVAQAPVMTSIGPLSITISLGVAALNENASSMERLTEHADRALYRAKEAGRNQVAIWDGTMSHQEGTLPIRLYRQPPL